MNEGAHPTTKSGTVGDLLEEWLAHNEADWSPTVVKGYRLIIDRRLLPRFGTTPLRRLTTSDLDRFRAHLRKRGGATGAPLSPASVKRVHALLRRALGQAVKWGYLSINPAVNASPPRAAPRSQTTRSGRRGAAHRARRRDKPIPRLHPPARRDIGRASRQALRAAWKHVDLDGAVLLIVLRNHKKACTTIVQECGGRLGPDAYVFSREVDGSVPWRPGYVTLAFTRLRDELGLTGIRLHDLRHFNATNMLANGTDIRTVSGRLGHADASTTLNIYAHFVDQADREAASSIGALLDTGGALARPRRRTVAK